MGYRDDERRWKRIQDLLAAEAGGKAVKPVVSQRTLFGIPSTVEKAIERIVSEDEEERRVKRRNTSPTEVIDPSLRPALDVADVIRLEQAIASSGISLGELMDRAGTAIAHRVHETHPRARIAILCGNGNNGGDGWVAARELASRDHAVSLITHCVPSELKAQPARDAAASALPVLAELGVAVLADPDSEQVRSALDGAEVIVDALLGTGFTGDTVKEPFGTWISYANRRHGQGAFIVAADTPSGLNAQTGTASNPCITADETVTMIVPKTGLLIPEAAAFVGKLHVAPLAYIEPLLP